MPILVNQTKYSYILPYSSFTTPTLYSIVTYEPTKIIADYDTLYDPNGSTMKNFEMIHAEWFDYTYTRGEKEVHTIQGWLMKPINFTETKKYPMAFLIHGGPEGAWEPSWSYRWNPQLWANRNYVVVMINPHGSSGMGIEFQDAVRNDWGGLPFDDLMAGLKHVTEKYKFIDGERVGACGASYGGFMVNWIQGHNDDKKFKCLVTHDGVFSTVTMFYATEELWFPLAEYCPIDNIGCKPFEDDFRKGYEEFSPENYANHWNTPHLIIHGGLDYRIPITEGISAFTTLQLREVPSRFLHFPEENHWVLQPQNSIKWYDEVLGWLDKYLENN